MPVPTQRDLHAGDLGHRREHDRPRRATTDTVCAGGAIIAGHNLLDTLHFPPGSAMHVPWVILHDRGWLELSDSLRLRTSYPVLPWIGLIALGYCLGPWFSDSVSSALRQRNLLLAGTGTLVGFVALRLLNGYSEAHWVSHESNTKILMSFFNITKYPPSLLLLALTLGMGLLLLYGFERAQQRKFLRAFVPLTFPLGEVFQFDWS